MTNDDLEVINAFYKVMGTTSPTLEQLWSAMDFTWHLMGCDNLHPTPAKLSEFYAHPVWLLNGLFTEQHDASVQNREEFSDWVRTQSPKLVADFGGGFGTLARMVGKKCPDTDVHIIEPYPHPLALERLNGFPNVCYRDRLERAYNVIVATDVFEHVIDPLAIVAEVSQSVRLGGKFLIANCFYPVMACHLPRTFHFRFSWHIFMALLGFHPDQPVCYGWSYEKRKSVERKPAKIWEGASRLLFPILTRSARLASIADRFSLRLARERTG